MLRVNGSARTAVVRWDSPDSKVPGPTQAPSSDSGETRQEEDVSCYALRVRSRLQMGRWCMMSVLCCSSITSRAAPYTLCMREMCSARVSQHSRRDALRSSGFQVLNPEVDGINATGMI